MWVSLPSICLVEPNTVSLFILFCKVKCLICRYFCRLESTVIVKSPKEQLSCFIDGTSVKIKNEVISDDGKQSVLSTPETLAGDSAAIIARKWRSSSCLFFIPTLTIGWASLNKVVIQAASDDEKLKRQILPWNSSKSLPLVSLGREIPSYQHRCISWSVDRNLVHFSVSSKIFVWNAGKIRKWEQEVIESK
jgi:hypothetical protein